MMDTLYVIGNGFDLHHGLKTSYYAFADFLRKNHQPLYHSLESYVAYPDSDKSLWSAFESNLAKLNIDDILSENSDRLPEYASEDFKEGDRHIFPDIMQEECERLTAGLIGAFTEFIRSVVIPPSANQKKIAIDNDANFLTFNYTDTLERIYNIEPSKIIYIHNSAYSKYDEIILGHGIDPASFEEPKKIPPAGLSKEETEKWIEENDDYDYSYSEGKAAIMKYFKSSYKPTAAIIARFSNFFSKLNNTHNVYVLGHSISEVDLPYCKKLVESVSAGAIWHVSFYDDAEKTRHLQTLTALGIDPSRIMQFELIDI